MSKVPIIRAISWPAVFFQLGVILLLSLSLILGFEMEFLVALMIAGIVYSAIAHLMQAIFTPHHRRAFRSL